MSYTSTAVLVAVLTAHTTAIVALAVVLGRTREKLARVEEWQRMQEKRINGQKS